jgi:hypothetical protein
MYVPSAFGPQIMMRFLPSVIAASPFFPIKDE